MEIQMRIRMKMKSGMNIGYGILHMGMLRS